MWWLKKKPMWGYMLVMPEVRRLTQVGSYKSELSLGYGAGSWLVRAT